MKRGDGTHFSLGPAGGFAAGESLESKCKVHEHMDREACDHITVNETRTRGRRGACSRASVKGKSDLSESIKRRCHGNDVSTLEGHKMERAFPSCWEAVKNDTQLKPHTASFKSSLSQRAFSCLRRSRQDFEFQWQTEVCLFVFDCVYI